MPESEGRPSWGAIAALAAVVSLIGAGAWTLATYMAENRIEHYKSLAESYEQAKDFKISETLKALNTISEKVRLNQEEREVMEKLQLEVTSLSVSNSEKEKR